MFDSVYKEGVCSEQGKHKEIMETFLYGRKGLISCSGMQCLIWRWVHWQDLYNRAEMLSGNY